MGKGLQILNGGPWSIRGQILNLQIWSQGIYVHEVAHDYLKFWVQIHGLPQKYINADTARDIGNRIGIVAEVEDPRMEEVLERTFLRVKVAIDVSKPLPTRFWMDRNNLPNLWIEFKYERLQDCYCLNCGIIDHSKKECKNPTAMACWNPREPKYSIGLGVAQARRLKPRVERGSKGTSST
ncbi:uncharacterized protein At4g02000-like [Arachis hypogaea]|uniref:uncharacterized protein At4g02000-like n=1 Tax=Arachis hypogaea TaxID=3818 RepID=UPI003B2143CC